MTTYWSSNTLEAQPQEVVRNLLTRSDSTIAPTPQAHTLTKRIATLEREVQLTLRRAHDAGVEINYLGISQLFAEPRLYSGVETDWVLGPATRRDDAIVPHQQRKALERLVSADINFPLIFIAHEVAKEKTNDLMPVAEASHVVLNGEQVTNLVGPVPAPASAVELGERLAVRSTQVLRAVGKAASVACGAALGVVAAPVVLVAGAAAGLATLDPIILGAVPAATSEPGAPAAWYVLARWEW